MENNPDPKYKWKVMLAVSIGIFMATLDGSIVNIALPTLSRLFDTDISTISWVILSYLLTITTFLLTLGRLSDMYGRKKVFAGGLLVFSLGSGLCSLSTSVGQLIAFRIVQGFGAAMILATSTAIVTFSFPHTERGKAMGIIGTIVSVGSMTGPVLGGFLIDLVGWQSIFYINVPIGIFASAYSLKVLESEEVHKGQKFDIPGAFFMFICVMSLMLAITQGQGMGWNSPLIIGLFSIFVIALMIFLYIENKASQPMVELSMFKHRPFSASNASSYLSFVAMFTIILMMPYYMEEVLNYSTIHVGMTLIAIPLVMAVVAPVSGWLSDKTNSFMLSSLGMVITCVALYMLGILDQNSTQFDIVIGLGLVGLGMGLFQSPNNSIIMGSVPVNRLGIAGSLLGIMRNLGMITGIAISSAVFTRGVDLQEALGASHIPAFLTGYHDAFMVAVAVCTLGVLTSMVRGDRHGPNEGRRQKTDHSKPKKM
ncbi:MAG TPA: DHA2 family efflux MFS transporter permease subunit [Methanosarcinaceae archaeon]|nr:DHA2 family efflux MFS transporter permease subunit [Methanosarcinaceae archaeon]